MSNRFVNVNANDEINWEKRAKTLSQVLIISGALNFGLLGTFFYFALKKTEQVPSFSKEAAAKPSPQTHNSEILTAYSTLSFQELLIRLEDDELVEEGYTRRDLALATLVAFHHFNIEAVLHDPLQRRRMSFVSDDGKEEVSLTLFPGLQDYQFEAILHYAHTERWPFRAEGLFLEIKQSQTPYDPTLLEAFWITSEFHLLETLFKRTNPLLAREDLLQLIIEGEWQIVSEFVKKGIGSESEAIVLRNELLTQYLNARSKTAAKLILISDEEYALKRLDDHQVVILLDLISERGQEVETFIRSLLTSKRSDEVWKKAAKKFYDWLGETLPDPYDHRVVLYRLFPNLLQKKESVTPKETLKKKRIHIVTERENLWKISRKYKVSIEELKKINHLETEKLKPGQQLEIP